MAQLPPGTWVLRIPIHNDANNSVAFTNMPAADTLLFSSARHITKVDLSGMSQARLLVFKAGVAGNAGSTLMLRYSDVFNAGVGFYTQIGSSEVAVAIDTTNTFLDSGWVELNNEVKALGEVFIAIVGTGGDGVLDPTFGSITVEFQ